MLGERGVRYIAEDAPSGYGDAADRLVRALRADDVLVEYRGWSDTRGGAVPEVVPFSRDDRPRDVCAPDAPTIVHLVPEYYPEVAAVLPGGPFVAHTVWETDRLPQHWPAILDQTDLVLVPTEWNREVFVASGVEVPVRVVAHVATEPVVPATPLAIPDDLFVFYAIGRWDQRKAMFLTVQAFLEAFTADDPVLLVVKTGLHIEMPPSGWAGAHPIAGTTAMETARLVSRFPNPPRVQLEASMWTEDQIHALHARGDCYVTLARGEGWGIGAFDACAYGNPVVATGWGGFLEYLDHDNAFLVDSTPVPVSSEAFASYSNDQHWAEPDVAHGAALLREVFEHREAARARAAIARERVLRDYSPAAVARQFRAALADQFV